MYPLRILTEIALITVLISVAASEERIFNLTSEKRDISSIKVSWEVPDGLAVDSAEVFAKRMGGQVRIQGLKLLTDEQSYELTDLLTNSKYNVCLSVAYSSKESRDQSHTECLTLKTIAVVRPDSVYVLFIVVGVLVGLGVLGCVCWWYDRKKLRGNNEDEASGVDEPPTEDQNAPILKANAPPAYSDRPNVSIEDQDIPYITPPRYELERQEREKGRAPLATIVV